MVLGKTASDALEEDEKMTLNEYQQLAQRTSRKDISPDDHLFNGILGLAG